MISAPGQRGGLVDYGLRHYSPELGRWISRDPIQERGGYNLYSFVDNQPVLKVDSLGMLGCSPYEMGCYNSCELRGEDYHEDWLERVDAGTKAFEECFADPECRKWFLFWLKVFGTGWLYGLSPDQPNPAPDGDSPPIKDLIPAPVTPRDPDINMPVLPDEEVCSIVDGITIPGQFHMCLYNCPSSGFQFRLVLDDVHGGCPREIAVKK